MKYESDAPYPSTLYSSDKLTRIPAAIEEIAAKLYSPDEVISGGFYELCLQVAKSERFFHNYQEDILSVLNLALMESFLDPELLHEGEAVASFYFLPEDIFLFIRWQMLSEENLSQYTQVHTLIFTKKHHHSYYSLDTEASEKTQILGHAIALRGSLLRRKNITLNTQALTIRDFIDIIAEKYTQEDPETRKTIAAHI